jgi:hypothetical protein
MTIDFLAPEAVVLAVAALIPLVFLVDGERRAERVGLALGLVQHAGSRRRLVAGSIVVIGLLLGLAAAQPVITIRSSTESRPDAEVWYVLDSSRSMLASSALDAPTRFDRARDDARKIRMELAEVRSGIASLTDRLVPHLFPTDDAGVFGAVLDRAVGIDRPPPAAYNVTATTLGALTALVNRNFYTSAAERRVVVVFTDAESRPFAAASIGQLFQRAPGIDPVFIRYGNLQERVFALDGGTESGYSPHPNAAVIVRALAGATGGRAFDEGSSSPGRVADTVRALIGSGETEVNEEDRREVPLAPYLAALAFLPLGILIWRRNL